VKKLLILISVFCALKSNAQDCFLTFSGTGSSSTVSSVKVENLTSGKSLVINGSDILHLISMPTGFSSIKNDPFSRIRIYPNPMTDYTTVQIRPPLAGEAVITIVDFTGRLVYRLQSYLDNSRQDFKLSGLKSGFYLINVASNSYQFSGKLLSNRKTNDEISFEKVNSIIQTVDKKAEKIRSKGALATVEMECISGDRLKFTGISEEYSTVKIDVPETDKTINFNFIACSDGDNNNYPVVEIGTQVWMAENLKTTKFNDDSDISLLTDYASWHSQTPGYCWYDNDYNNKNIYGAIYNVRSVRTNKLCPTGWRVPSRDQWNILLAFLGGENLAGSKLKETGTLLWQSPNTGATNESGFTALPGGLRHIITTGSFFVEMGTNGNWWSSDEWIFFITNNGTEIFTLNSGYWDYVGTSVRCIKDN